MSHQVPTLKTERLILRPWRITDAPDLREICDVFEVAQFLGRTPFPLSLEDAQTYLKLRIEGRCDGCDRAMGFAITLGEGGRFIGSCGLRIHDAHQRAEMGYFMHPQHHRKGYVTEACRAVLRFAFDDLGMRRVAADYQRRNAASARVLQKLGFTIEGCLRKQSVRLGIIDDVVVTGLLKEEWNRGAVA
jgi:RimJ/RimL family protein N-acetyltransferase